MRGCVAAAALIVITSGFALAQEPPAAVPQPAMPASPNPALPQSPAPSPESAAPAPPAGPPLPQATPAPPPPSWQTRQTALVQVLDKVDGQATTLTVPVGTSQSFRNIAIVVRSCYARPPDQPPDATAFLVITETGTSAPAFTGWMLANEPTASMLQDPVYDVRVLSCT